MKSKRSEKTSKPMQRLKLRILEKNMRVEEIEKERDQRSHSFDSFLLLLLPRLRNGWKKKRRKKKKKKKKKVSFWVLVV